MSATSTNSDVQFKNFIVPGVSNPPFAVNEFPYRQLVVEMTVRLFIQSFTTTERKETEMRNWFAWLFILKLRRTVYELDF